MFTTMKIGSCEYYLRADERGDRTSYYVDGDPTGLDGETQSWFVPPPTTPIVNGMVAFAMDGAVVAGDDLRALGAGRHPVTQATLTQRRDVGGRKPVVGQDCTFSAPKSVSVLFAVGTPEQRREIRAAQEAAVRRALTYMHESGLVRTRRGSGSKRSEAAVHWCGAIFHHSTSRQQVGADGELQVGDVQIHSHVVVPAVVGRKDGTGALDNSALLTHARVIGALYRAELATQLRTRLGVECERDDRVFRVAGCPQEAVDAFSKRRAAVVEAMDGRDTASNRQAAQKAAILTRTGKSRTTAAELEESWTAQLAAIGHSPATIAAAVEAGGATLAAKRREGLGEGGDLTESEMRGLALDALAVSAVRACFDHDAVCPKRKLLLAIEAFQGLADATTALAAIDKAMGGLVEIGIDRDGDAVWTTPELIAAERSLLVNSVGRLDEREWIPAAAVEAAIAAKVGISEEQSEAVRWLCGRSGVSVLVGSAGSGKSWSSQCVVEAARLAGEYGGTSMKCFAIAPSWAATDVVRSDADVSEAMAAAVAAFVARIQNGKIALDSSSLIVVDEAGMIPTESMAQLLDLAKQSKVCLLGDPLQLQPVGAGSPLKVIASRCGTAEIRRIKRQQNEWQRAASERFAKGDCGAVLDYDDRGYVTWADGKDDAEAGDGAMQKLVADWSDHLSVNSDFDDRGRRTRLCLASRNADVHRLNTLLRAEWRAAGRLGDREFSLKSIHRGQNSSPQEIRLAVGDALIWGERIELRGQPTINNSDGCTVLAIDGDPADPTVRIRLDKGGEIEARWSQYVGKPKPNQPAGPRSVRCQHYYCATIHQSQGRTVGSTFLLNAASARGLGSESVYVGLTRHTTGCRMYVDASALMDRVSEGDPSLTDEQEQARVRAELRNLLVEDSNRSERKTNVAEYAADPSLQSFITTGDLGAVPTPAELLRRRLDARKESVMEMPSPSKLKTAEQARQEVDHWRRMDLGVFLTKEYGWRGRQAAGGGRWTLSNGEGRGAKIGCKRMDSGRWAYTTRNGSEHGDIFAYLSARHGLGFSEACRKLRSLGYGLDFDSAIPWNPPLAPTPRPDGPLSIDDLTADDRANVSRLGIAWVAAKRGWTDRLTTIRRLSEATLSYFAEHIRHIGAVDLFAHRFSDGTISGWEEKHPIGAFPDGRTGSFAVGGKRTLFRGGNQTAPTRICIFEATVDALSYHDLRPDPTTLYLSMGGNVTEAVKREVGALARKHKVEWRLCVDNDASGIRYREALTAEILAADPAAVIVVDLPTQGKDWNDTLVATRRREDGVAVSMPEPTAAPIMATAMSPTKVAPTLAPNREVGATATTALRMMTTIAPATAKPHVQPTAMPLPTMTSPPAPTPFDWLTDVPVPTAVPNRTAPPVPPPVTAAPADWGWLDDLTQDPPATTEPPHRDIEEDAEDTAMAARIAQVWTATTQPPTWSDGWLP